MGRNRIYCVLAKVDEKRYWKRTEKWNLSVVEKVTAVAFLFFLLSVLLVLLVIPFFWVLE